MKQLFFLCVLGLLLSPFGSHAATRSIDVKTVNSNSMIGKFSSETVARFTLEASAYTELNMLRLLSNNSDSKVTDYKLFNADTGEEITHGAVVGDLIVFRPVNYPLDGGEEIRFDVRADTTHTNGGVSFYISDIMTVPVSISPNLPLRTQVLSTWNTESTTPSPPTSSEETPVLDVNLNSATPIIENNLNADLFSFSVTPSQNVEVSMIRAMVESEKFIADNYRLIDMQNGKVLATGETVLATVVFRPENLSLTADEERFFVLAANTKDSIGIVNLYIADILTSPVSTSPNLPIQTATRATQYYNETQQTPAPIVEYQAPAQAVVVKEKEMVATVDTQLSNRLRGHILLQVENNGEAWYVDPKGKGKYYLQDGDSAYQALKKFGYGITNSDIEKIPIGFEQRFQVLDSDGDGLDDQLEEALGSSPNDPDTDGDGYDDKTEIENGYSPYSTGRFPTDPDLQDYLKGKILIQTERHGEAWYVNPNDGKRYYMKNGELAYQIMRYLSLGITNTDLRKIPVGE
ncbi:MAG: hypothetical protein ABIH21_03250 [Patescibacteria group bacterium]